MSRKKGFYERFIKRPQDFLLALIALIILSPILVIIAILIRIKLGSPVFFVQERPGLNQKLFKMYKFRTMTNERDSSGELLPDSVRLTRFGRFLRRTSLDELPELYNILKGEMSLIGPRPLAINYLPYYSLEELKRHNVRPGLSGLAQINGRNDLSWESKFSYDIQYIDSISLKLDALIALKTIKKMLICADVGERGVSNLIDFDVYRQYQIRKGDIEF